MICEIQSKCNLDATKVMELVYEDELGIRYHQAYYCDEHMTLALKRIKKAANIKSVTVNDLPKGD